MQPKSLLGTAPSELCLIRLSALGDCCHTVPVVRAIQRAWPGARITWVVGKVEHGLLRGLDGVEFAVFDKSRGVRAYADLRRRLGRRSFPLLLHMHPSSRANFASLAVRAPLRLGFDRRRARDFQYYFCNRHIPPRSNRHVMDALFEFAEALGVERGPLQWDIPVDADDRAAAERAIPPNRPSLVISPCAVPRFRNYRNWRAERYAAVADLAAERYGARVLLTGGPTPYEHEYGRIITSASRSEPENLIGKTTLKQLLAILERASVVLCPDSGPAHMATAVRTPVVGLYATTNPQRAGPYLSRHLVVDRYPEAVRREHGVPVEQLRWGTRVRKPHAMDLISVDDVAEKLDLAFAEAGAKPVNSTDARREPQVSGAAGHE